MVYMSNGVSDYADIIHVRARTWGESHQAPTSRPWTLGAGMADDDQSGRFGADGPLTNREYEELLDSARANGQIVEVRSQMGRLRMEGGSADARAFNRRLAAQERAEFKNVYPNGCPHCGKS
jgi:hypothetical protein